jgi:tRNA threonylcarbamoyl adenosine modification protein YeaZ
MIVVGIDTSDRLCTVVISNSNNIIGGVSIRTRGSHLKDLIPVINYLVDKVNINMAEIDLFVIVQGPGNWSGIRIGVTSVKCLALSLNKNIVGINALDCYAFNFRYTDNLVFPIIDASKNQVYFSVFNCQGDSPKRIAKYDKKKIDDLLIEVNNKPKPSVIIGSAIKKYSDKISSFNDGKLIIESGFSNQLNGNLIIEAGMRKYKEKGADNILEIAPVYLQRSDAEKYFNTKYKSYNQKNENIRNRDSL